ncbi:MAG: hypothetical protein WCI20_08700 [bacterium]
MKTKRTIEINGEACKVLSIERKDYNEPVDRESGTAGQRSFISYAITVRRHILRVKYPDGAEKQITIDPIIPDRPDDFEPLKILSLPADPALPKGISRIYCDKRFFCADVTIKRVEPEKKSPAKLRQARINHDNGQGGGRPTVDSQTQIDAAVRGVRDRRKNNPSLGMKRACEFEIKEQGLSIKWQGLQKHVKRHKGGRVTN